MRHGSSNRRQRSRGGRGNNGRRGGQNKSQVYDSNGPDVRIRGTAYQVTEKYMALAKDAAAAGDDILAESYLQHAEHYQRIISSWNENENVQSASDDRNAPSKSKKDSNDELGLPASILGNEPNAKSEARTAELSDA